MTDLNLRMMSAHFLSSTNSFDDSWNNEFPQDPLSPNSYKDNIHFGDLVTMTIVDVFETDCDGKLLSYCPTFDNRAVYKTAQRVERIRKGSTMIKKNINVVASSPAAARVNKVRFFYSDQSGRY